MNIKSMHIKLFFLFFELFILLSCGNRKEDIQEVKTTDAFIGHIKNHNIHELKGMLLLTLDQMSKSDEAFRDDIERMAFLFEHFSTPLASELIIDSVNQNNGDSFVTLTYPIKLSNDKRTADSAGLISADIKFTLLRKKAPNKILRYEINESRKKTAIEP